MKKQLLGAIVFLLLLNHGVYADEIRLTSTKTDALTLGIVTSTATTVTVDWGNGIPVSTDITQIDINGALTSLTGVPSGEIVVTGAGITVFDCSLSAVTTLNVTQAPNLIKLSVNDNLLSTINLTQNVALYSLHLEKNPSLTTIDLTNNTDLQLLYCNDNNMTSLDVTHNTKITTLNFNTNKIVNINLSQNTALKSLYATTNLIESIDLSNNTQLTYISLNTNKLTTLDVTPLTALKSLFLLNNNLTSLIGANPVAKTGTALNCSGNKLNFATLPQPEALKSGFNYAPQQAFVIPESIIVGQSLDLSSQTNVKGILASAVATTFQWKTKSGTALANGTDYQETNGVFTFLVPQTETVICSMTSAAFPKFTTASPFKTTEMAVITPTSIDKLEVANLSITPSALADKIEIKADATILNVEIYNASGRRIFATKSNANNMEVNTVNFGTGVFIAKVTTDKGSSVLKFIIKK